MSQDSRSLRSLALVALFAGLVGCAPLPIGSESNSKSNAITGERLSSSQNAPSRATTSAFESTMAPSQNAQLPTTASSFESLPMPSSQTVASAATDAPMIESPPTTRFAAPRDSAGIWNDGADYKISSLDILQVA